MKFKKVLVLVLCLVSATAVAKKKKNRNTKPSPPYKYYYLQPIDASQEWTYATQECVDLPKEDYKFLSQKENCKLDTSSKRELCKSRIDVELKHSQSNEKKTFGLNYIVFDSRESCEADRSKLTQANPQASGQ